MCSIQLVPELIPQQVAKGHDVYLAKVASCKFVCTRVATTSNDLGIALRNLVHAWRGLHRVVFSTALHTTYLVNGCSIVNTSKQQTSSVMKNVNTQLQYMLYTRRAAPHRALPPSLFRRPHSWPAANTTHCRCIRAIVAPLRTTI